MKNRAITISGIRVDKIGKSQAISIIYPEIIDASISKNR